MRQAFESSDPCFLASGVAPYPYTLPRLHPNICHPRSICWNKSILRVSKAQNWWYILHALLIASSLIVLSLVGSVDQRLPPKMTSLSLSENTSTPCFNAFTSIGTDELLKSGACRTLSRSSPNSVVMALRYQDSKSAYFCSAAVLGTSAGVPFDCPFGGLDFGAC